MYRGDLRGAFTIHTRGVFLTICWLLELGSPRLGVWVHRHFIFEEMRVHPLTSCTRRGQPDGEEDQRSSFRHLGCAHSYFPPPALPSRIKPGRAKQATP
jgi:hypothetical protein